MVTQVGTRRMVPGLARILLSDLQGTVLGAIGIDDGELAVGCQQQLHGTVQGFSLYLHCVVFLGLKEAQDVLWF